MDLLLTETTWFVKELFRKWSMWLVNESFCTELALFVLVLFWTESASVVFELACAVSVLFVLELWYELLEIVKKMFWKKSA